VADVLASSRGTDWTAERARLRRAQAPPILDEIRRRRDLLLAGPVTQSALAEGAAYLNDIMPALIAGDVDPLVLTPAA